LRRASEELRELVFCTAAGEPLDAANVRRSFRAVCRAAGIGADWTPRERRHTFVSLMSDSNVAVEQIARLVGHASSKVTETCTVTSSGPS
jgi:site-specific recombinase XerC